MMDEFVDNLPIDGRVKTHDSDEIFIYRGYNDGNTRRCACERPEDGSIAWIDRWVLSVCGDAKDVDF